MVEEDDAMLSLLLPDPVETMAKMYWSFMKDLKPWPFSKDVLQSPPLLPNLYSEQAVADRFQVSLRTIRDRSRERGLGRKIAGTRWLSEPDIFSLMDGDTKCLFSKKDMAASSGRRGAPTSESKLTEALELVTKGKLKPSSQRSKTKSSSGQVVAFSKK